MKYCVTIPITGYVAYEVEANDKKSAISVAWEEINAGKEGDVIWEYTDTVVEGNCFHGMQNETEVTKLK